MITGMPRIAIAVHDFESCVTTFANQLRMPVIDVSATSVASLGAKLAMCVPAGGSNIELMSPADPAAPLSQSLQRFLDRRGEGLFALMLEAPDPNAEADELIQRGLNVLPLMPGAGGRDIHPASTHGVLIRVYPVNSFQESADPAQAAGAPDARLSGIVRVVIAVNDLDHAATVYGHGLGLAVEAPSLDTERGVRSILCRPPAGGTIELVAPVDVDQPFARSVRNFLDDRGEGMFALVLESDNLQESATALQAEGLDVTTSADSPDVLEIPRQNAFGALLRIEKG